MPSRAMMQVLFQWILERSLLRLLASLVTAVFAFSSVGLFKNLKTSLHRDVNNSQGVPNILVPCSDFSGGSVKVSASDSSEDPVFLESLRSARHRRSSMHPRFTQLRTGRETESFLWPFTIASSIP